MPEDKQAPKKAPPRNDFKTAALYKNSRALELQGRDPDYHYEYLSTNPEHPSYIEKKLRAHEIGNQASGFATVDGWEVVHANNDRALPVERRDDQGKPVDSTVRYGRQVLCRIRRDEHAKYKLAEEAYQNVLEKQIYEPDHARFGSNALTSVVSRDEHIDQMELLKKSGHQIPGA